MNESATIEKQFAGLSRYVRVARHLQLRAQAYTRYGNAAAATYYKEALQFMVKRYLPLWGGTGFQPTRSFRRKASDKVCESNLRSSGRAAKPSPLSPSKEGISDGPKEPTGVAPVQQKAGE